MKGKKLWCILLALVMSVGILGSGAQVDTNAASSVCYDFTDSNSGKYFYYMYTHPSLSYLIKTDSGYLRLQAQNSDEGYVKEYYVAQYLDTNYNCTKIVEIPRELPIFGAFYYDGTYFYVVSGQENPDESADVECFRITKYDSNWKKLSSVGLKDCNTTVPFDAGSCAVASEGNNMVIRTCHEMYAVDGVNHQANITLTLNTKTMKIVNSYTGIANESVGYISHSFNQFVKLKNGVIYASDHGDAYPRGIYLAKYNTNLFNSTVDIWDCSVSEVTAMEFSGIEGDNITGASEGGFEISSTSYLMAISSVNQDTFTDNSWTRNIYLLVNQKNQDGSPSDSTKKVKLTSYAETTLEEDIKYVEGTPKLVDLGDDTFLILWVRCDIYAEEGKNTTVYYQKFDKDGNALSSVKSFYGCLSDCQPIVTGGKVVWFVNTANEYRFYEININTLESKEYIRNSYHETELKNAKEATCTTKGYTGDQVCKKCGTVVEKGEEIAAKGHSYKNGYCSVCGTKEPGKTGARNRILKQNSILRVYGNTRYGTSLGIADQLKAALGVSKFDSVIIANSNNFPDALSGSYLATVKNAPILIVNSINGGDTSQNLVLNYVKNNLQSDGTIYVLGGNSAVSSAYEKQLASYGTVKRLSGDTRFDTNLAILKAASVKGDEILVADASASFADALSASSTGKPLLLVNKGQADKNGNFTGTLTTAQLNYLKSTGIKKVTILGGTQAVPTTIEKQIKDLGITVTRLAGSTRYETSAKIAAKYFSKTNAVTLAWGGNFPDALCGGPLANAIGASVVLTDSSNTYAKAYVANFSDFKVVAFGGAGSNNNQLTDAAINNVKKGTIVADLNKN